MTETSIIPDGATATDDGVGGMLPAQPDQEGGEGGNRRRLLILGAVAGVIVLAAAAYLLLHKGSSSTPSAVVPHGVVSTAPSHKPAPAKTTHKSGGSKTLPKANKHQLARDPFIPLILAPADSTGSTSSSGTGTGTGTSPTTSPSPGTTPTPTPTPTNSGGTGSSAGPHWIQLLSTSGQTAVFKIGYGNHKFRDYTVVAPKASSHQGTIFAKVFALISVQKNEATVQFGDDAPFILTKGQIQAP